MLSQQDIRSAFDRWIKPDLEPELASVAMLGPPISIKCIGEVPNSNWIVNVSARDRIIGSLEFDSNGILQRYEIRARELAQVDTLPTATTEMSLSDVRDSAKAALRESGTLLDADRNLIAYGAPSKLAWLMYARDPLGNAMNVYVTQNFSWIAPPTQHTTTDNE
jgi:hypothetical protein